MPTTTWLLSKDATVAGGSYDYGNSADQHAPVGLWGAWLYRHFAQFAVSTAGMDSISSATLHVKSSAQTHVGFGSSATVVCSRVTSLWTASGGSEGFWTPSATPKWTTQPSVTSSGATTTAMTRTNNTWDTLDVTAIAQAWLAGQPNYGIRLAASNEASSTKTWEAYARASAYDMYITVVYAATPSDFPPTVTAVSPLAGSVADLAYTAGSGAASPAPVLSWAYADTDGQPQAYWRAIVYSDAAGSPGAVLWDSGQTAGSAASCTPSGAAFAEGGYYHWQVMAWDASSSSAFTATERFRTRWGAAEYIRDLGAAPTSWSVSGIGSSGSVVLEYNSSTDAADPGAGLGAWQASLASVARQRYVRWRVWLLPASGTTPSLDSVAVAYNAAVVPAPDKWSLSAHAAVDTAIRVYGSKSLRIDPASVDERTWQLVTVQPNTQYYLHAQVRQSALGSPLAYIALAASAAGAALATATASALYADWTETGVPWSSGANTSVYILCGAAGTGTAWFDAVKLEASPDPTQWLPQVLSAAVVLDGSGLKIDASAGGSLRIRGSAGTSRDEIKVDAHGLLFGGDTTLYSPSASNLRTDVSMQVGGALAVGGAMVAPGLGRRGGPAFPGSPASGDTFWRTDLALEFYYDGTRWLSATLFLTPSTPTSTLQPYAATAANADKVSLPGTVLGNSDIWLAYTITNFFVTAGTALSGANSWVMTGTRQSSGSALATTIASINSGASSVWRQITTTHSALLTASTAFNIDITTTKTGTPGSLYVNTLFAYRLVAV